MTSRSENRTAEALRSLSFMRRYTRYGEGAVLVTMGNTQVVCTASIDRKLPGFLRGKGRGWLTAEYGMLPRSTHVRMNREARDGKQSGRSQEIQRLIGRSLRAAVDLSLLGERQIILDCDVIQADGGTRCAAINGAWIALHDACQHLVRSGDLPSSPLVHQIAAVSVGVVQGQCYLDLDYNEDSNCDTDMNLVMQLATAHADSAASQTISGKIIEIQGTAEAVAFSRNELNQLLDLAEHGISIIAQAQRDCLREQGV